MLERSHCKGPEKCTCLVFIGLPERRAPATGYGLRATTKTKTKTRTKTRTRTRTTTTTTTKTTTTHDHDHDPRPRPRPRNHENHDRDGYDHDGDQRREGVKVGEGRAGGEGKRGGRRKVGRVGGGARVAVAVRALQLANQSSENRGSYRSRIYNTRVDDARNVTFRPFPRIFISFPRLGCNNASQPESQCIDTSTSERSVNLVNAQRPTFVVRTVVFKGG